MPCFLNFDEDLIVTILLERNRAKNLLIPENYRNMFKILFYELKHPKRWNEPGF